MKGWGKYRLKHLAAIPISNGLGEKGEYDDPAWPRYIRTTDIAGPKELRLETFKSLPPSIAEQARLKRNDILMTAVGATIGKSYTFSENYPACFAGYLVCYRPNCQLVDERFIAYWMQSTLYWAQVESQSVKSTIENFSASRYQNLSISIPSLPMQKSIADYLDNDVSYIDTLIKKKAKLVDLLGERFEVMCQKETSGSGFGRVPLRRVAAKFISGGQPSGDAASMITQNGEVEWATPGDFGTYLNLRSTKRRLESLALLQRHAPTIPVGSVLMITVGATLGKIVFADRICSANPQVKAIVTTDEISSRFLAWYLWSQEDEIRAKAPRATLPFVTISSLKDVEVVLPPLDVQQKIVQKIDAEAALLRALTQALRQQIDLLSERRQALITAAVTGEHPVPGVV